MFSIIPFLSFVLISSFTPGPNNIMAMSNSRIFGFYKTLKYILGCFLGCLTIYSIFSLLNVVLMDYITKFNGLIGVLGTIYMMYLSVKILKSKVSFEENESIKSASFMNGFLLQFINPKVLPFAITALTNFILPYFKSSLAIFLFSFFIAFVGLTSLLLWSFLGTFFSKFIEKYNRPFNIIMSSLMFSCALSTLPKF